MSKRHYTITYTDDNNIRTKRYFSTKELRNIFVIKNQALMRGIKYGSEEV